MMASRSLATTISALGLADAESVSISSPLSPDVLPARVPTRSLALVMPICNLLKQTPIYALKPVCGITYQRNGLLVDFLLSRVSEVFNPLGAQIVGKIAVVFGKFCLKTLAASKAKLASSLAVFSLPRGELHC